MIGTSNNVFAEHIWRYHDYLFEAFHNDKPFDRFMRTDCWRLASRRLTSGAKQVIRSLVLSRTYRLSSSNDAAAMQVDPDNRLLWRMNRQRLDAESLRDGLLAVSGELPPSGVG